MTHSKGTGRLSFSASWRRQQQDRLNAIFHVISVNGLLATDCLKSRLPPNLEQKSLPDLRAQIASAEWLPGNLRLELHLRVPFDQLQLQIIHLGSSRGHQLLDVQSGEQQIEIPDDALKLSLFLIDRTGDCVAQLYRASVYETYGKSQGDCSRAATGHRGPRGRGE